MNYQLRKVTKTTTHTQLPVLVLQFAGPESNAYGALVYIR